MWQNQELTGTPAHQSWLCHEGGTGEAPPAAPLGLVVLGVYSMWEIACWSLPGSQVEAFWV